MSPQPDVPTGSEAADNNREDSPGHIPTRPIIRPYRVERRVCAQATPITGGVQHVVSATAIPSPKLDLYGTAMSFVSPPIEDGERCHICDAPATQFALRVCWCDRCIAAMFAARELKVMGKPSKAPTPQHAMEHAFRWHRIVSRLTRASG